MATTPYERLRTQVENNNKKDRGLPDRKSANVSEYQQWAMHQILEEGNIFSTITTSWMALRTIHGTNAMEMARVLEAYATLMRNGVREFGL